MSRRPFLACARIAWIASSSRFACVCDSSVRASVAVGAVVPDVPTAPCVAAAGVAEDSGADCEVGFADDCDVADGDGSEAVVPAALDCGVVLDAAVGFEALEDAAAAGSADEPVVDGVEALPPAAFSNAFRCVRNSTSFARIAGSSDVAVFGAAADDPAGSAALDPDVPVADVDPVPVVPAVDAVVPDAAAVEPAAPGSGVAPLAGPINALRLVSTFAYASFQLLCVVISSLKFEMSCDTCVRWSPCSFAASGMDASCASVSRASLNACFAAAASTCVACGWADVCAAGGCAGFCGVAGSVLCVAGVVD